MNNSTDIHAQLEAHESFRPIVTIPFNDIPLVYRIPNRAALWRVETLPSKEPCTIAWLDTIEPGSILLDVGANVGMYTILAAKAKKAIVYAFEPESQNYALLNENIHANGLSAQVTAYCAALSDHSGLNKLYLSEFSLASSCHSLGEEVGFDLKPRAAAFTQGAVSFSLDEMVENGMLPIPNYIKIDVDGFEHKVLLGAQNTLSSAQVKSIIVELNPNIPAHLEAVALLNQLGFQHSEAQVSTASRTEGTFTGVGEWIFSRRSPEERVAHTMVPTVVEQTEETHAFALNLLDRMESVEILTTPFPHAVIENIFPPDYYEQILRHFPSDAQMIPLSETGRTNGNAAQQRLVTLFNEEGFDRLSPEQRHFFKHLGGWLYSPAFINGAIKLFWPHVKDRLTEVSKLLGWARVRGDALLVSDQTNYRIGPHTDAAHRLITFLYYLPHDERFREFGTSIYSPKDPQFTCQGGPHHPFDGFHLEKTIPFLPNSLLMFCRTDQSFHGVEPIQAQNITRHLLINNIRLVDS